VAATDFCPNREGSFPRLGPTPGHLASRRAVRDTLNGDSEALPPGSAGVGAVVLTLENILEAPIFRFDPAD
jgi:hypothetical protein